MIRTLLAALLVLAPLTSAAQTATSGGVSLPASQIDQAIDRQAMRIGHLPADRRGTVIPALRALGPAAADRMIARLGADSPAMTELKRTSPAAYDTFVGALLDALGTFKTPRAEPTLRRFFEATTSPKLAARMGAEGLGRLCTTSTIATLTAHATNEDPRHLEAATGLGLCRDEAAVSVLTRWLASNPPPETTQAVALALGMMGSSWAWQALGPTRAQEGQQLRAAAAAALIAAYPHSTGDAAHAIVTAILMVDEPSIQGAIDQLPAKDVLRVRWTKLHRK
jgi:HEAT repeat protein